MEWHTEAVDQNARPISPAADTLVSEPPHEGAPEDRLEALTGALAKADMSSPKAATLRAILKNIRESIDNALRLLDDAPPESRALLASVLEGERTSDPAVVMPVVSSADAALLDRVVEGVFDGLGMIGDDGKSYIVPPNYASKSKLVEGDMLKLTIGGRGNFIFKQIGPIERQRIIGTIAYDQETSQYLVVAGGRSWKVIKASITYFKADAGDEAVILAPKNAPSKWAAVENVIRKISQ